MRAAAAALALATAPVAAMPVLFARARADWRSCFDGTPQPFLAALRIEAEVLLTPFGLAPVLPFAALAAIHVLRPGRRVLWVWAGLALVVLLPLLDPAGLHHCDRKGTNVLIMLLLVPLAGFVAVILALLVSGRFAGGPSR